MATKKFTELTALTTPADDDLVAVTDDVAGTPVSKKVELGDLLQDRAYGQLYTTGGSGTQTLAATTWTKLTQWDTEGASENITLDAASDELSLDDAGHYVVSGVISFEGTLGAKYQIRANWNATGQNHILGERTKQVAAESDQIVFTGILDATTAGQTLYVEVWADGIADVDVKEASLVITKKART